MLIERLIMEPLVSILIRTCQRPEALRNALDSIRRQSYKNIQVVVVEDGEQTSNELLKNNFSDLNYIYEATNEHIGRSAVGNRAMEIAEGEYYNFLDDDDELLPKHIEILVNALNDSEQMAAYSVAKEKQIIFIDKETNRYEVKKEMIRYRQPFNRLLLYKENYFPIQSVLFGRKLYEKLGGFNTKLSCLEDWDLWVKYSTVTDFIFVDEITSCYYVGYDRKVKKRRTKKLVENEENVIEKFDKYKVELSVKDINKDLNYIFDRYKTKEYVRYLKKIFRAIVWGER